MHMHVNLFSLIPEEDDPPTGCGGRDRGEIADDSPPDLGSVGGDDRRIEEIACRDGHVGGDIASAAGLRDAAGFGGVGAVFAQGVVIAQRSRNQI